MIYNSRRCPDCGKAYIGYPALSRLDNRTLICPKCGIRQALETVGVHERDEQDHIIKLAERYKRRNRE